MKIKKYGAIDIGSNAVRLLVANVIEEKGKETLFKKSSLVRVPIRLGADSFVLGVISKENTDRMIDAMSAFKLIMKIHGVEKYKACATSAMREALNGNDIVAEIKEKTSIDIDVIDGKTEAIIISSTDIKTLINSQNSYLYIDVGGGSTEFTIFSKGQIIDSKSFKIGTVRLLNNNKNDNKIIFLKVEKWIKKHTKGLKRLATIGSGGNINKIFKLSGKEVNEPISLNYLKKQHQFLKSLSYEERISDLGLNPDRADVIIPAIKIYLSSMKWSKSKKIYVPKIGLADGIIKSLYYNKL